MNKTGDANNINTNNISESSKRNKSKNKIKKNINSFNLINNSGFSENLNIHEIVEDNANLPLSDISNLNFGIEPKEEIDLNNYYDCNNILDYFDNNINANEILGNDNNV